MIIRYLKFGKYNCSEHFMVMFMCHACASVIFIDFSEYLCSYLLIMLFYGIKVVNTI